MLIPPKIGVVNTRLNLIKKGGRFWFNGGEKSQRLGRTAQHALLSLEYMVELSQEGAGACSSWTLHCTCPGLAVFSSLRADVKGLCHLA